MRCSSRRLLAAVFALGLMLRVGFVLSREDRTYFPDTTQYAGIARNLLSEGTLSFSDELKAVRAPGYPVFLAGCFAVFGDAPLPVRLVQAIIGAATCLLVFALARELFDTRTGTAAALICAVYPFFVFYTGLLLTETVFTGLLAGCMLALQLSERRRWWLAIAGVAAGTAILVRPSALLLLPFLAGAWLLRGGFRRRIIDVTVIVLLSCLCLGPWVLRNYRIFGRFVPTTLTAGMSLYEANSPDADGGPAIDRIDWDELDRAREAQTGEVLTEYTRDRYYRELAFEWIRSHPAEFIRLCAVRLSRVWNVVPNDPAHRSPALAAVSLLSYVPVMLTALAGVFLHRHRLRELAFLLAPALCYSLLHSVFVGSIRYRAPVMPFLMILSAAGITALMRRRRPET